MRHLLLPILVLGSLPPALTRRLHPRETTSPPSTLIKATTEETSLLRSVAVLIPLPPSTFATTTATFPSPLTTSTCAPCPRTTTSTPAVIGAVLGILILELLLISIALSVGHFVARRKAREELPAHAARAGAAAVVAYKERVRRGGEERAGEGGGTELVEMSGGLGGS